MICQSAPTFRLLDANVGWDWDSTKGRTKNDDPSVLINEYGLRIAPMHGYAISNKVLSPFIPPAWIASGCAAGEWFMCGQSNDEPAHAVLQKRDACTGLWSDLLPTLDRGHKLCKPIAVAVDGRRLALVDQVQKKQARLYIWTIPDGHLVGYHELEDVQAHAIAFTPWREVAVAAATCAAGAACLLRFDLSGQSRLSVNDAPKHPKLIRLARGTDGKLWAAAESDSSSMHFHVWTIEPRRVGTGCHERVIFNWAPITSEFDPDPAVTLSGGLRRTSLISATSDYACVSVPSEHDSVSTECITRSGQLPPAEPTDGGAKPRIEGAFCTTAIDSGIRRCRWHRVRIDSDVPVNASYKVQVTVSDSKATPPDPETLPIWQTIEGSPHDFLIDEQPPGQYLFMRIKMFGQDESPVIHRARIDFPRVTSLEQLPAVYREDPDAEEFTERFLSLFDAAVEDLDGVIERLPALLDIDGIPADVLPWLSTFLGIAVDPNWTLQQRRELLRAAPRLYEQRGTPQGLIDAIRLLFDVVESDGPVIHERALNRSFGVLRGNARLGRVRLFGKTESRFRIATSPLGMAPLRSFGNPDHDPVQIDAHRFEVLVPPIGNRELATRRRIDQLITSQKPAHTQHSLRIGGSGFVLGQRSAIGIDTQFVSPPPLVLADNDVMNDEADDRVALRLGGGILHPGPNRPTSALRIGVTSYLGIHTTLE